MQPRLATIDDVPAIAALMDEIARTSPATFTIQAEGEATWRTRFTDGSALYPWLIAEVDGAFAGFAKAAPYRPRDAYAYTVETSIYLPVSYWRRGIGRALYRELLRLLHLQGYFTAVAVVTTPNEASERLHEAVGMRPVGVLHQAGFKLGRWHDVRIYELSLQDRNQLPGMIQTVRAARGE